MSTFNEADHPRGDGGRFSEKERGEVDPEFSAPEKASRQRPTVRQNHDLLRGLPGYIEATVATEYAPDKPIRVMTRDMPRGRGYHGGSRRCTNLDAGTEWFIPENPDQATTAGRIISVDIDPASFVKNWPDAYGGPYGMDAAQTLELIEALRETDHNITGTVVLGDFPEDPNFEMLEGVRVDVIDLAPTDMHCPVVYIAEQPGDWPYAVPITHFSGWVDHNA